MEKLVRELKTEDVIAALNATCEYAVKLPAANGKSASIGFCWGGTMSFNYAVAQPALNAAVVYHGTSPSAAEQMEKLGKSYTRHIYEGAGHGFLRAQDARNGANLRASKQAWRATIAFLREHTK